MTRIRLVLAVAAVMAAMLGALQAPAVAQDLEFDDGDNSALLLGDGFFAVDDDSFFDDIFDGFIFDGAGVSQTFDQEAESGDVDLLFEGS